MQQIAQVLNQVQSMAAASERVFAFLEEEEEVPTEHPIALPEQIAGTVSFQHVSFGYQPEQQIIHDFSAEDCNCGSNRCRKDDHGQIADAVL